MSEDAKSLAMRCRKYFGVLSGRTFSDFVDEFRQLTDKDKDDLVRYFNEAGMPTTKGPPPRSQEGNPNAKSAQEGTSSGS